MLLEGSGAFEGLGDTWKPAPVVLLFRATLIQAHMGLPDGAVGGLLPGRALPSYACMFEAWRNTNGTRMTIWPYKLSRTEQDVLSVPMYRWALSGGPCAAPFEIRQRQAVSSAPQDEGDRRYGSRPQMAARTKQYDDQCFKRWNSWSVILEIQERSSFGIMIPCWVSQGVTGSSVSMRSEGLARPGWVGSAEATPHSVNSQTNDRL